MKHLLCLLLLFLPLAAFAEDAPLLTVRLEGGMYRETPPVAVCDESFADLMRSLLSADFAGELPENRPANRRYSVTFHDSGERWTILHDDLYNLAAVTRPDGTVQAISPDVPRMLQHLCLEETSFDVPAEHRALLASHGWTIAFRNPHQPLQLPESLTASRTDANALHFTFADLFLRDAGYDIAPYLGKTVQPHVYTLLEQKNRIAWKPEDIRLLDENGNGGVLCSLYAVVLECEGQVIGAYLKAWSWDGSDLMSLNGKTAVDLLADSSIRQYLLERLPATDEERALAALSPEEVIRRYAKRNDPMLRPIDKILSGLGTASAELYPVCSMQPTGMQAVHVEARDQPNAYCVTLDNGETYYPVLTLESPETGWKVESFYNTGY